MTHHPLTPAAVEAALKAYTFHEGTFSQRMDAALNSAFEQAIKEGQIEEHLYKDADFNKPILVIKLEP